MRARWWLWIAAALPPAALAACNGGGGTCIPTSCEELGKECGLVADGCGGTAACGECDLPATCGGGGEANVCGDGQCEPITCLAAGKNCGLMSDGCATVVECGECGDGQVCAGNVCLGDGGGDGDAGPVGPGGGPQILMLSVNTMTLREDERLVVSAVVTDPDGVDDLIGGTLLDAATGAAYGAFATSAAEGSYEIDLGWGELGTVTPVDAPPAGAPRKLRARFFDVAGHRADQDVTVTLRCDAAGESACDGQCFDLESDTSHCGRCDRDLPFGIACVGGEPTCPDPGYTLCGDECVDLDWSYEHCGSCDNDCGDFEAAHDVEGSSCNGGQCAVEVNEFDPVSTTCAAQCGGVGDGLTCAEVRSVYSFYCPGADGWGFGCAYFETPSCGHPDVIGGCSEVIESAWASEEGWCDFPASYPRTAVVCFCGDGGGGGGECPAGAENTPSRCSDGCSNDGDAWSDCEDFDCCGVVECGAGTACGG